MANNSQRGRKNNNPEGINQYSGFTGMMRKNPVASAAAAAVGAAAAGIFLWSKRDKITDQAGKVGSKISEKAGKVGGKLGEWTDEMRSSDSGSTSGGRSSIPTGTETPRKSGLATASSTSANARSTQKVGIPQATAPQVN